MEIELQEILDYLKQHPPFAMLDTDNLQSLTRTVTIRYLRRGDVFPPEQHTEAAFYLVRSGAIECRDNKGALVDQLGEGDTFAVSCLSDAAAPSASAIEDSLVYAIPCRLINTLRASSSDFNQYFAELSQRLKIAVTQSRTEMSAGVEQCLQDIISDTVCTVSIGTSIADCANIMTANNTSAVIITHSHEPVGILTDKDLRSRCLAKGIDTTTPVQDIMSRELCMIDARATLADALLLMTQKQIQHLPVLQGQQVIGCLTAADVIRHIGTNAVSLALDIKQAGSVEELKNISEQLPALQQQLVLSGMSPERLGETFSSLTDAITQRLIALAEEKLGPAPVAYVWLAGGSQGRNEQTSHSDQDNALLIDDAMQPGDTDYFTELSRFICDGLNACGYVYCPGEAMAMNEKWRQTSSVWLQYFQDWIEKPDKQALMLSSIFFDLRPVAGDRSLYESLQQDILAKTKANGIFISYMVANALTHRPPLGFFRNFVLIHDKHHDHTLDIKHRGIVPLVDIARVLALSAGIAEVNTIRRLRAVQAAGELSQQMCDDLLGALTYITQLRNRHQARQIATGKSADNFLDPASLAGLERGYLKDAFTIIKEMQQVLEQRHQTGLIA